MKHVIISRPFGSWFVRYRGPSALIVGCPPPLLNPAHSIALYVTRRRPVHRDNLERWIPRRRRSLHLSPRCLCEAVFIPSVSQTKSLGPHIFTRSTPPSGTVRNCKERRIVRFMRTHEVIVSKLIYSVETVREGFHFSEVLFFGQFVREFMPFPWRHYISGVGVLSPPLAPGGASNVERAVPGVLGSICAGCRYSQRHLLVLTFSCVY